MYTQSQIISLAQKYILDHDKDFKFYTQLVVDSSRLHQVIIQQIDHRPSLNRYKIMDQDVKSLNQQDFQGIETVHVVCTRYQNLLKDDFQVLSNYSSVARSQFRFNQEMKEILVMTKQLTSIIRNQLNIMRKSHFMQILLREVKLFNHKVQSLHTTFYAFTQQKFYDTIDIKYYAEVGDAKVVKNIDPFDSISKLQIFVERALSQCEQRTKEMMTAPKHNQANRGLQLSVLLLRLFQEQTDLMTNQSSLFNKTALHLYLVHQSLINECLAEFHVVELFLKQINESSCELIYLAFILKQELLNFGGQLNQMISYVSKNIETDNGSKSANQNQLLCQQQIQECELLLVKVHERRKFKKHFGEVEYFIAAIRKKIDKRRAQLKSLKNNILHLQKALKRIIEVLQMRQEIEINIQVSLELVAKAQLLLKDADNQNANSVENCRGWYQKSCGLNSKMNDYLSLLEADVMYPSEIISRINQLQSALWQSLTDQIQKQYHVQDTLSYLIHQS